MNRHTFIKKYGKKVFLKYIFVSIYMLSVIFTATSCSGSRTGTEITFSELSVKTSDMTEEEAELQSQKDCSLEDQEEVTKVYVHVCGAVMNPGVYELDSDSRVYEVIEAAGGLAKDADEAAVNQAGRVVDGQQIYVYRKDETNENKGLRDTEADEIWGEDGSSSSKVNLNTAGKEELMSLTGIGEAKAAAIIEYRENNGGFSSVDEIMKIDGIKQGVFQKIRDDITI